MRKTVLEPQVARMGLGEGRGRGSSGHTDVSGLFLNSVMSREGTARAECTANTFLTYLSCLSPMTLTPGRRFLLLPPVIKVRSQLAGSLACFSPCPWSRTED